jgi:hypothetical protein
VRIVGPARRGRLLTSVMRIGDRQWVVSDCGASLSPCVYRVETQSARAAERTTIHTGA